jgi:hypothetical protein
MPKTTLNLTRDEADVVDLAILEALERYESERNLYTQMVAHLLAKVLSRIRSKIFMGQGLKLVLKAEEMLAVFIALHSIDVGDSPYAAACLYDVLRRMPTLDARPENLQIPSSPQIPTDAD